MPTGRIVFLAVLLPVLAGCSAAPLLPGDGSALTRGLPDGVRMTDYVERDPLGRKITVGAKLVSLGAHPGPDGKLIDRSGRPITFFRLYDGGTPPTEAMQRAWAEEFAELKRTSTVIEIYRDPDLPLPQ
jgi:hypothetical protein